MLGCNSVKDLRVTWIVKEIETETVWSESESKEVSGDNNSQGILDQIWLLCEVPHYGKSLVSVFQEIFSVINTIFVLGGGMDTRLLFHGV